MSSPAESLTAARIAQAPWQKISVNDRLRRVAKARELIARDGMKLAEAARAGRDRPLAEKLTAEVIPLAAAAQFLEEKAAHLLKPRILGRRGRPVWLARVETEVRREPFGVVLIVGPANYPLFLPGVQALQALVAGNAVLLKPGRNGSAAAHLLAAIFLEAGMPSDLLQVLPEDTEHVYAALDGGVDLVIFTGSTEAGQNVLRAAAARMVPVIAELSGEDPVFIRADADAALASKALRFGNELNGGDSCIAPRRVFAPAPLAALLRESYPSLPVTEVAADDEALDEAGESAFALGATIFSRDESAARGLAGRAQAGIVMINDCILPAADPRIPFGGRNASGFGVTRGAEGLLALTRPKVICLQRGRRRHLEPAQPGDEAFFLAYLQAAHGRGWRHRLNSGWRLIRLAAKRGSHS